MPDTGNLPAWTRLVLVAPAAALVVLALPTPYRAVASPVLAAALIAGGFVAGILARQGNASLDEIGVWFVGAVLLYATLPLLAFMALGLQYTPFNDTRLLAMNPTPAELGRVAWLQVAYLAAFAGSYLVVRGRPTTRPLPVPSVGAPLVTVIVAAWFAVTLLLLLPGLFYDLGATSYVDQYRVIQQLPLGVRQVMKGLVGARVVVDVLLLLSMFRDYRRFRFLIAALLAWLVTRNLLLGGSRTELMVTLAVAAALYHRFVRPVRLRTAVAAGSLGLVLFSGLGLARSLGGREERGPFTLIAGAGEFESLLANAVDLRQRRALGEFPAGQLSLAFADVLGPVPSQLLPFPKRDLAGWYLDSFYPQIAERGGGLAFGVVSQAIIGWGWLDLLARGAVTGAVFAAFFRLYRRRGSSFWITALNCYLIAISYHAYRASTFHWVTLLAQIFLPTVLCLAVAHQVVAGALRATPATASRVLPAREGRLL